LELAINQIGETGSIELLDTFDEGISQTINFNKTYTDPIVVAYVATRDGNESIDVMINNITLTSCDIYMREPDYEQHVSETINYFVVESGRHKLKNGIILEAGRHQSNSFHHSIGLYSGYSGLGQELFGGDTIPFSQSFSSAPAILHSINSKNTDSFITTVSHTVTNSDFVTQLELAGVKNPGYSFDQDVSVTYNHDLTNWTVFDSNFIEDSTYAYLGSHSAGMGVESAPEDIAEVIPSGMSGGVQPEIFEFYYYETTDSTGGGLEFIDSNGNPVLGIASDNSEWDVIDANGVNELYGTTGIYGKWHHVHVTFDWVNGTCDIFWEDTTGGHFDTFTNIPLINNTNIEKLVIKNYQGGFASGEPYYMWLDNINFWLPEPTNSETIGWIAFEQGTGSEWQIGTVQAEGLIYNGTTGEDEPQNEGIIDYSSFSFSTAPIVIASGNYGGGEDGYWARGSGTYDTTEARVLAEEDNVADYERSHAVETIGYIVLEASALIEKYTETGNRISPQLDLSAIDVVDSSVISWSEILNGETIDIETSVDNQSTWQTTTNGGSITDIQGADTLDIRQTLSTTDTTVTPVLEDITAELYPETSFSLDTQGNLLTQQLSEGQTL